MCSRNFDVEAPELIPSTKDILGEHLHYKVQDVMEKCVDQNEALKKEKGYKPADKITGMLLERSESEIVKMLQDERYLVQNIQLAIQAWREECADLIASRSSEEQEEKQGLSYEEMGELLFEKVAAIEKEYAPQITGMLLELDTRTLLELLRDESSLLQKAVEKAKISLLVSMLKLRHSSGKGQGSSSSDGDGEGNGEPDSGVAMKERIGCEVYGVALEMHPECAAILTGMILELDKPMLQEAIDDPECLKAAIEKAYEVWDANT